MKYCDVNQLSGINLPQLSLLCYKTLHPKLNNECQIVFCLVMGWLFVGFLLITLS